MVKKLKYSFLTTLLIYLMAAMAIYINRLPSYSLHMSGKLYIVNKLSRDVQVVDLRSGNEITRFSTNIESHEALATLDDKNILLTDYGAADSKGSSIKVINTAINKIERTIQLKKDIHVNGMLNIRDPNKVLLVDYVNNNLVILNTSTDSVEGFVDTHQKRSHLAVLHPTKPLAYVTNMVSNSISVVNIESGSLVKIVPCGLATESLDITPDGTEVWASNKNGNSISVISTDTHEVINTLPSDQEPLKIKFSIDGNICLVANANAGTISVYNGQDKKQIKTINIPGKVGFIERILYHTPRPVNILMHPNGKYAFVSNSNARKIEVIDLNTLKIVGNIGTKKVPDALAYVE